MRPIKYYFNTHTFDHYFNCITVCEDETDADFIVMGAKEINLDKCTRLKGVYRFGVGLDNVPVDKLKERNIPLHLPSNHTREILYKSTANFTVYLILRLIMEHAMGDRYTWKKTPRSPGK